VSEKIVDAQLPGKLRCLRQPVRYKVLYGGRGAGKSYGVALWLLAELGLPDDGFVFCCFNQNYKIAPPVFEVWMNLLRQVEGSVLWLVRDNADAERNLRPQAGNRGIAPQRLVFAPLRADRGISGAVSARRSVSRHVAVQCSYHGGRCAMGGPAGRHLSWRELCRTGSWQPVDPVGLPELITTSLPEYEALALNLARELQQLAGIRAKLARNRGTFPLFDMNRFTRHIESAYRTMWERYQESRPPAGFAVDRLP
jgi:hypothetical protein